ncbi:MULTISPECIES: sensor histidine kinase [Streptomyces]|uniref:sensor histidine kinase n=1 Tax=Streptomyces TaxID=1883 RepID=UPI0006F6C0DA|nr:MULTISPECIES: HAMP domain-containing sensor histidine kinase [Streptomyces]KQZ18741.1 histidine kinase [Streptomyces sp. Root55]MDX2747100.1 HAMP domain-containing sensor histidine kinase [Streptomyces sp. NRRL_B-2557]MDX3060989.1 HAMP domain-containing sensor histidine kinase [Streptomyces sp. ND04-05B]WUC25978.1 HAMP domain-containing histidine kinase [Streptomyces clavifer]GHB18132.1 two-component sensor histidine kinase [Streptomyces clavifer]
MPGATAAFGLRTRLVIAFLLVAAVSAVTTAALTYREARSAVLVRAQDTAVASFREEVEQFVPSLPLDPDSLRWYLYDIAARAKPHPWIVFAEYGSLRASSGDRPVSGVLTQELRRTTLTSPHGSFERVVKDGSAYLTIGMPVMTRVVAGGDAVPSGLVLFAVMPMTNEEVDINALVTAARDGALPGLAVALVPALLASRSVLRPVRELRRAARSMGGGQLDTRIPVHGRDEMADLARTFNESAARLERSVEELREAGARARRFASDVSHELRTPLAGMLAVTDVVDEDAGTLAPDTARAVRLISAETGKLAVLVEDLMEISRFDARAAELNADEVDAAEAVRSTLSGRQWLGRVRAELPDGFRIRLDPRRFDVIVANLVGNALRHGAEPVTVRLSVRGDVLITEVHDSGPGIAPDALPHIFDRFYKADAARTRSSGSGLGLAITVENIQLHGGTISAENAPGGGALFTVELPFDGPASGCGAPGGPLSAQSGRRPAAGRARKETTA